MPSGSRVVQRCLCRHDQQPALLRRVHERVRRWRGVFTRWMRCDLRRRGDQLRRCMRRRRDQQRKLWCMRRGLYGWQRLPSRCMRLRCRQRSLRQPATMHQHSIERGELRRLRHEVRPGTGLLRGEMRLSRRHEDVQHGHRHRSGLRQREDRRGQLRRLRRALQWHLRERRVQTLNWTLA